MDEYVELGKLKGHIRKEKIKKSFFSALGNLKIKSKEMYEKGKGESIKRFGEAKRGVEEAKVLYKKYKVNEYVANAAKQSIVKDGMFGKKKEKSMIWRSKL